jgi:hypothetical protein
MNIIFYNHFHNGDIHLSRTFIEKISYYLLNNRLHSNFFYSHRNSQKLLRDLTPLVSSDNIFFKIAHQYKLFEDKDNAYFINTWYASNYNKYMNNYGITFDTLYDLFDDLTKTLWKFSLADVDSNPVNFFPKINYDRFEINSAKQFLSNIKQKKVFIQNGLALSGQSNNFNFTNIIANLSKKFPDLYFVISDNDSNLPFLYNAEFSSKIINIKDNDLNENAYISSMCDVIIGRASGSFTFAFNQDNLFNRETQYICFSNLIPKKQFWLGDKFHDIIDYKAKILNSNTASEIEAEQIITKVLEKL